MVASKMKVNTSKNTNQSRKQSKQQTNLSFGVGKRHKNNTSKNR